MAKEMVAMLLAGGQGSRLYALTQNLAKPAVPFGGKYRIIDFPISNCVNSGIDTVGVLTQYQPVELNDYINRGIINPILAEDLIMNVVSLNVFTFIAISVTQSHERDDNKINLLLEQRKREIKETINRRIIKTENQA